MRIAFSTFGCKINQYDTDAIRREVAAKGGTVVPFDDEADVYVINTCTVTAKSDYQCRQAIRSAARRGKGARVVVTGCYAETRPEEIRAIPGVDLVIGNSRKASVADAVMSTADAARQSGPSDAAPSVRTASSRTRGFLKIQDGCDSACSYCIVPAARGRSRSVETGRVTAEFERMVAAGCPEVVLSGIHIGLYGADLGSGMDLTKLLGLLLDRSGSARVRLSSVEPREITPEIIGMLGNGLCRHLHIPLQSGDDSILAAMKRDYTAGFYLDLLRGIAGRIPDIALGADVMVGFPGEGDSEFENTLRLVEESPLTHLHVFSYSPRPGTPAAAMKNQVPEAAKKERSEALRLLGQKKNLAFRQRLIGSSLEAVVEYKFDAATGSFSGLTDNYVSVIIEGSDEGFVGKKIEITITSAEEGETIATIR